MSFFLVGDAFFWLTGARATGTPPADAWWLPHDRSLGAGLSYATGRSLLLGAAFLVFAAAIAFIEVRRLAATRSHAAVQGLVILAAGAIFPGQVALLMAGSHTWGNARYFAPLVVSAVLAAAWLLRDTAAIRPLRRSTRVGRRAVVAVFAAACLLGTASLADAKVSAVESEAAVFGRLPGLSTHGAHGASVPEWRRLARDMDARLKPGDLVILDTDTTFPVVLFSRHPGSFLIPSDRDYEQLAVARLRPITYAILATGETGPVNPAQATVHLVLAAAPSGWRWVESGNYSVGTVYHLESVGGKPRRAA